ncbi:MAG: lipid A biosynthesis acyltransferase [Elusimicrobia bacterium]|nr:lipid A biosynthesis acyltransferase [Elusimicrobiota bacterium]
MPEKVTAGHRPAWLAVAETGSRWGMGITAWVRQVLGYRVAREMLRPIVLYYLLRRKAVRRWSRAYLTRALGRPAGFRDVFRQGLSFATAILDRLDFWRGRWDAYHFDIHVPEDVAAIGRQGKGVVFLSAHLGSHDALRALINRWGWKLNVVMYRGHSPLISELFRRLTPAREVGLIEDEPGSPDTVLRLREAVARGECVGLLGDREPAGGGGRGMEVPFFGRKAIFPSTPFLLAALLECPVFLALAVSTGPRRYSIHVERIIDRIPLPRGEREQVLQGVVRHFAERLEYYCRLYPYEWFNFYDFWNEENA